MTAPFPDTPIYGMSQHKPVAITSEQQGCYNCPISGHPRPWYVTTQTSAYHKLTARVLTVPFLDDSHLLHVTTQISC